MKVYITVLLGLAISGSIMSLVEAKKPSVFFGHLILMAANIIGIVFVWSLP